MVQDEGDIEMAGVDGYDELMEGESELAELLVEADEPSSTNLGLGNRRGCRTGIWIWTQSTQKWLRMIAKENPRALRMRGMIFNR